jgi:hypothetical protein
MPPSYQLHLQLRTLSAQVTTTILFCIPIRLVAAEAGFLPPGPCVDFADILEAQLVLKWPRGRCV